MKSLGNDMEKDQIYLQSFPSAKIKAFLLFFFLSRDPTHVLLLLLCL